MVEFASLSTIDLTDYRHISTSGVYGTLGLININKDVFLSVITAASPVATLRPGENVQRIVAVEFCRAYFESMNGPRLIFLRLFEQERFRR